MNFRLSRLVPSILALLLFAVYSATAPANHAEAEDVYDYALKVEQGSFADQAGVNRLLALPVFGIAYRAAGALGYDGRAFPFMIFINRILAVGCILLFYRLLSAAVESRSLSGRASIPSAGSNAQCLLPYALMPAFSYGFWRYANEAEMYILASVLVLGAWCLAVSGRWVWCVAVSALGVLVHLLNLVPLLLILPLYYLLSGRWRCAVIHGVAVSAGCGLVYAACFRVLDWGQLGAHHHGLEAGLHISNLIRGTVTFGQSILSANFLFGFEAFREFLTRTFPSRMLAEEFYMAGRMPAWIPWAGVATLLSFAGCSVWVAVRAVLRRKTALECGGSTPLSGTHAGAAANDADPPAARRRKPDAFLLSTWAWLILYGVAVMVTEAGSPELWIMALIPFSLIVARMLHGARHMEHGAWSMGQGGAWILVAMLFIHNLAAGLLPVMTESSDYHAAKAKWLVEHTGPADLILTDYEPVMIFYLNYYAAGSVVGSGSATLPELQQMLGNARGNVYCVGSLFNPMPSMQVRSPVLYERMAETGKALQPAFVRIVDDDFGGIWERKESRHGYQGQ